MFAVLSTTPFIDEDRVVDVGRRLGNDSVTYFQKHPVILSNSSKLSKIYSDCFHKRLFHIGPQSLLNAMHLKFCPLNGHSIACKTINQFVVCFKSKPVLSSQNMGILSS